MNKDKKLNLDNTTKMTLSLAAVFAPLFLNSNTANAGIGSRFGRYVFRTASNVSNATNNPTNVNSFRAKLSGFLNSKIVLQKPPVDQGPIVNFIYTRIIRQPAQSNVIVLGTQPPSRRPRNVSSHSTSRPTSGDGQTTNILSQSTSRLSIHTPKKDLSFDRTKISKKPGISKTEMAALGLEVAETGLSVGILGAFIGSLT